jgi:predicted  nucleic acid-binding Zn-ribbon protein
MHPDLVALLALQEDDVAINALEGKLQELDARSAALDRERQSAAQALDHARSAITAEEEKRRALTDKLEQHKALQDKNLHALDQVKKQREATAAMSQIEITRKALAQEGNEMQVLTARISDLRHASAAHEEALAELDAQQAERREALAKERAGIEGELAGARAERQKKTAAVSRSALTKYERIRSRNATGALVPLRGQACGQCNTAIPLQRRNVLAGGRGIDVCEGCGVLLYAPV